jgi:dihydroorotase
VPMKDGEIVLPGLIDMHVHLRDPGYTAAEDFDTGTRAALAGGVVTLIDMPNNKDMPTWTVDRLDEKYDLASQKARTGVGFYFGAPPDETMEIGGSRYQRLTELFTAIAPLVFGLKLYWDITTGSESRHGPDAFRPIVAAFLEARPSGLIVAHTEGRKAVGAAIDLVAGEMDGRIHIPHISKQEELEEVIRAKQDTVMRDRVTTEVSPHHFTLIDDDVPRLGWLARMKPSLGAIKDAKFLRDNIAVIDAIATDHAPHPLSHKEDSQARNPDGEVGTGKPTCFGVPGLETMLSLLLKGEQEGWITREQIIEKTHTNPARILGIEPPDSEVHVDNTTYTFTEADIQSKCGWSPYVGMEVVGRIGRVVVDGESKVVDGEVVAMPGSGRVLRPAA